MCLLNIIVYYLGQETRSLWDVISVYLCLGSRLSAGESLWKNSLPSQLTSVSRETDACWQRKMLLFLLVEQCCDIKDTPAGVVWVYKRCVMSFISPPAICLDGENQNVFLLPMMGKSASRCLFVCLENHKFVPSLLQRRRLNS